MEVTLRRVEPGRDRAGSLSEGHAYVNHSGDEAVVDLETRYLRDRPPRPGWKTLLEAAGSVTRRHGAA